MLSLVNYQSHIIMLIVIISSLKNKHYDNSSTNINKKENKISKACDAFLSTLQWSLRKGCEWSLITAVHSLITVTDVWCVNECGCKQMHLASALICVFYLSAALLQICRKRVWVASHMGYAKFVTPGRITEAFKKCSPYNRYDATILRSIINVHSWQVILDLILWPSFTLSFTNV